MVPKDSGAKAVRLVAGLGAALGGCWVLANGMGSGDLWSVRPVVVALVAVVALTAFAWFLTKVSHGGDWAKGAEPTDADREAREVSHV